MTIDTITTAATGGAPMRSLSDLPLMTFAVMRPSLPSSRIPIYHRWAGPFRVTVTGAWGDSPEDGPDGATVEVLPLTAPKALDPRTSVIHLTKDAPSAPLPYGTLGTLVKLKYATPRTLVTVTIAPEAKALGQ